jgi:predicted nucleic acid-binding protein
MRTARTLRFTKPHTGSWPGWRKGRPIGQYRGRACTNSSPIVTHPRIYEPPTPLDRALDQVAAWLESPTLVTLTESPTHWVALRTILTEARVAGPQVHDARVAALCRQHGVRELRTADRDFSRFSGLAIVNPLLAMP